MVDLIIRGRVASPVDEELTLRCIESARKNLRVDTITVVTWREAYLPNFENDNKTKFFFCEPIKMLHGEVGQSFIKPVPVLQQSYLGFTGLDNVNSSRAIVCRNDIKFINNNIENLFAKKLGALVTYNPLRNRESVNNICDWIHFGDVSELRDYYSFHKYSLLSDNYPIRERGECEHLLFLNYLKRKNVESVVTFDPSSNDIQEAISNYGRFTNQFTASQLGITSLKFGQTAYAANPYLSAGLFSPKELYKINNNIGYETDQLARLLYHILLLVKKLKLLHFIKRIIKR